MKKTVIVLFLILGMFTNISMATTSIVTAFNINNRSTQNFIILNGIDCSLISGGTDSNFCDDSNASIVGGGGLTGKFPWLYNDSTFMFFNDTHLNLTISRFANQTDLAANSTRLDLVTSNLASNSTRLNAIYVQQSADNTTMNIRMENKENITQVDSKVSNKANQSALAANSTRLDAIHVQETANNATQASNLSALNTLVYTKISTGDGGGNATASSVTNFFPYSFNATHFIQSLMAVVGATLRINYTSVNITSTLYVNEVNVTGQEIADNSTQATNLTDLRDRVNLQATLQNVSCTGGQVLSSNTHLANGTLVGTCVTPTATLPNVWPNLTFDAYGGVKPIHTTIENQSLLFAVKIANETRLATTDAFNNTWVIGRAPWESRDTYVVGKGTGTSIDCWADSCTSTGTVYVAPIDFANGGLVTGIAASKAVASLTGNRIYYGNLSVSAIFVVKPFLNDTAIINNTRYWVGLSTQTPAQMTAPNGNNVGEFIGVRFYNDSYSGAGNVANFTDKFWTAQIRTEVGGILNFTLPTVADNATHFLKINLNSPYDGVVRPCFLQWDNFTLNFTAAQCPRGNQSLAYVIGLNGTANGIGASHFLTTGFGGIYISQNFNRNRWYPI